MTALLGLLAVAGYQIGTSRRNARRYRQKHVGRWRTKWQRAGGWRPNQYYRTCSASSAAVLAVSLQAGF